MEAAKALKESLLNTSGGGAGADSQKKRKHEDDEEQPLPPPPELKPLTQPEVAKKPEEEEEPEPVDEVQLWREGWRTRYYQSKFSVDSTDTAFLKSLVRSYCEGFSWVMKYYYQGCPSWKWFYPHHFSPFASDFQTVVEEKVTFGNFSLLPPPQFNTLLTISFQTSEFLLSLSNNSWVCSQLPPDFRFQPPTIT